MPPSCCPSVALRGRELAVQFVIAETKGLRLVFRFGVPAGACHCVVPRRLRPPSPRLKTKRQLCQLNSLFHPTLRVTEWQPPQVSVSSSRHKSQAHILALSFSLSSPPSPSRRSCTLGARAHTIQARSPSQCPRVRAVLQAISCRCNKPCWASAGPFLCVVGPYKSVPRLHPVHAGSTQTSSLPAAYHPWSSLSKPLSTARPLSFFRTLKASRQFTTD